MYKSIMHVYKYKSMYIYIYICLIIISIIITYAISISYITNNFYGSYAYYVEEITRNTSLKINLQATKIFCLN